MSTVTRTNKSSIQIEVRLHCQFSAYAIWRVSPFSCPPHRLIHRLESTGLITAGVISLLQVVDGWELQGELFPSPEEVEGGLDAQYKTFCGAAAPPTLFTSSQNVALVQFRVPRAGQGFRVRVRFLRNPEREYSVTLAEAVAWSQRVVCPRTERYPVREEEAGLWSQECEGHVFVSPC